MSRIDALTGKRAQVTNSRSHSNIATKRQQKVNLQTVRIGGQRIRVAASTIKTLKRMAAMAHGEIPTKRQKKQARKAAFLAKAKANA
jgi:ribosomal protein L28